MAEKPTVLLWLPSYDGWYHARLTIAVERMLRDRRYDVTPERAIVKPVEYSRNLAAEKAVNEEYDWLIMMDNDNPPLRNPLDLIELDKDIVGVPTPIFKQSLMNAGHNPLIWNVFVDKDNDLGYEYVPYGDHGLMKVDGGVGTGCILIRTKILKEMLDNNETPFVYAYKEGEDLYFCRAARQKGYEVWAHWDYACDHMKEVSLLALARAIDMAFKAGARSANKE